MYTYKIEKKKHLCEHICTYIGQRINLAPTSTYPNAELDFRMASEEVALRRYVMVHVMMHVLMIVAAVGGGERLEHT